MTNKKKEIRIIIPLNPLLLQRSKPEQNKLDLEIGQMTKKKYLVFIIVEEEVRLTKKLQFQNDTERKMSRFNTNRKIEKLMEKKAEIANELSCLVKSQKKGRPEYSQNDRVLHIDQRISIHLFFFISITTISILRLKFL